MEDGGTSVKNIVVVAVGAGNLVVGRVSSVEMYNEVALEISGVGESKGTALDSCGAREDGLIVESIAVGVGNVVNDRIFPAVVNGTGVFKDIMSDSILPGSVSNVGMGSI